MVHTSGNPESRGKGYNKLSLNEKIIYLNGFKAGLTSQYEATLKILKSKKSKKK